MEHGDLLLTIAEVAVAFAGFASIVGILGTRSASSAPRVNALRMRIMLLHSLVVVAFSLVPHILHSYGLQEGTVWRASSGLYVIVLTIVGVSLFPRIRKIRALPSNVGSGGREGLVANPIFLLEAILSLLNVLGLTRQAAAAILPLRRGSPPADGRCSCTAS